MNEPELFKKGDPRVSVHGLPLQGDGRFVPEALYQQMKSGQIFSTLEVRKSSGINIPAWILLVVAIGLILITMWFTGYFKNDNLKKAEYEKSAIETKRDSVELTRTTNREELVNNSQTRATQSSNITKKFTDEKITIRDTSYSAMCEYIVGFRPE